jgi:hypothetical protein
MTRKAPVSGIEPGSLHGSRPDRAVYVPQDESAIHQQTLKEIAGLSGSDFITWKKTDDNGQRLAAALRFKKEQQEDDANS